MSKTMAIIGAGGLGREVLSLLRALPEWRCVGFYDDGFAQGLLVAGLPVLGPVASIQPDEHLFLVMAIGNPLAKKQIMQRLSPGLHFATLIHPRAVLQDPETITLGAGVIIGAGSVLTTDISVGAHTLINLNCTVGHNVRLGMGCSLMPGAHLSGEVKLKDYVLVGSGACVLNGMLIAGEARIGAGAVVTRPVAAGVTVAGVPAREIETQ